MILLILGISANCQAKELLLVFIYKHVAAKGRFHV